MKNIIFFVCIAALSAPSFAQINFRKNSGSVTILPNSVVLPTSTITPTAVSTNNPFAPANEESTVYADAMNAIFQHVDRAPVSTGLLKDYGMEFTRVGKHNGVRSTDNYAVHTEWQALYLSLYSFIFNANAALPHPGEIDERAMAFSLQSNTGSYVNGRAQALPPAQTIPVHQLVALHYGYQQFRSDATSANLVYVSNNKIYDTPGRTQSPYETKEAFAIAPIHTALQGATHTFVLRPELYFTNLGKTIASFGIDFGEGFQTYALGQAITYTYGNEGEKTIAYRVTYTDGSVYESHSKVSVSGIVNLAAARYDQTDTAVLFFPFRNFAAPQPYLGQTARARVTIEFANNGRTIRKPLIVVEGFDPWHILTPDEPDRNFEFLDLIQSRESGGLNVNVGIGNLNQILEDEDYDLIFIDFEDGTDYIQRNALLVRNVIEYVNAVKQPLNGVREQNVVLGFSMGGLVGRYALRHMEQSSTLHETRLLATIDSPHQGANVPLGFQAMVTHLSGVGLGFGLPGIYVYPRGLSLSGLIPELSSGIRLLNSPAARQMMRYQVVGFGSALLYDNSLFTNFMNEYHALGNPVQEGIRVVALSNGSECGTTQGFAPGAAFFNVDESRLNLPAWGDLLLGLTSSAFLATNYPQLAIGGLFITDSDVRTNFVVNALPNQANQRLYKGKIYVKRKILFVINVDVTLVDKEFYSPSSLLALDSAPGGFSAFEDFGEDLPFEFEIPRFCFVPTFSSLNIGGYSQPINPLDLTNPYSTAAPPLTPKNVFASNFFTNPTEAGQTNSPHIQLTARNGLWLFQQIQNTPQNFSCSYMCGLSSFSPNISGASLICTTSSTFTLNNIPPAATISWSATGASLVSGQGTASAAFQSTTNGSGAIRATITGACGNIEVSKAVNLSVGASPTFISVVDTECFEQRFETNNVVGNIYNWTYFKLPSGTPISKNNTTYNIKLALDAGSYRIGVNSSCNSSVSVFTDFTVTCGSSSSLAVYPNPVSEELTIELLESGTLSSLERTVENKEAINVYFTDMNAEKIYESTHYISKQQPIKLPMGKLKEGMYILKIRRKDEEITRQFIVDRTK
jgi:pimeloyl-ACP methyl ester carboxylesterase